MTERVIEKQLKKKLKNRVLPETSYICYRLPIPIYCVKKRNCHLCEAMDKAVRAKDKDTTRLETPIRFRLLVPSFFALICHTKQKYYIKNCFFFWIKNWLLKALRVSTYIICEILHNFIQFSSQLFKQ